jgi:heme-degrading monooxygenase HmoA
VAEDLVTLPQRPYYAVIFSSQRSQEDSGYETMAAAMFELASQQPGYLGAESARSPSGFGITVSYFDSPESIRAWAERIIMRSPAAGKATTATPSPNHPAE